MKKYFAVAAVAVMVFAFSAFAASFIVEDEVLGAGVGDVESCTESATVDYAYQWEPTLGFHRLTTIYLTTNSDACRSLLSEVKILDADNNVLASVSQTLSWNGNASYQAWEWGGHVDNQPVDIADIYGAAVVIKS